ncbi:hypothetical protein H8D29_07165 [PVC group bacterium]|nr:hypothetical protein [PVC group bacterium]
MQNISIELFRVLTSVLQGLENNRTELEDNPELVDLDSFAEHIKEVYNSDVGEFMEETREFLYGCTPSI